MLHTQQYLQTKSLTDLENELGIKIAEHPHDPLVILNYDQIESPKTHPIVRECRGLVLHKHTFEVVAKSFNRFFNWGEVQDEMGHFDFSNFIVQDKEDGSLAIIYFYEKWRVNTRGSFALDNMQFQDFTWQEAICRALHVNELSDLDQFLDRNLTYVCEFCSPWNKIVRRYEEPRVYLLTAFEGDRELSWEELEARELASDRNCAGGIMGTPGLIVFNTLEEIQDFLREQEVDDPTYEGVVIRDINNRRWKIKSATYLGLHRLRGEGDNMWNPKHLLPFVLAGEEDELLTYFPEVKETFYKLKAQVLENYSEMVEVWGDYRHLRDQKEFALAVKDTPFASILFSVRREHGDAETSKHLRAKWRESDRLILKRIQA